MSVGENIERIAKTQGMNLRQLAIKAGVPYNTIYSAAKRKSNKISYDIQVKVAAALNVKPMELQDEFMQTLLSNLKNNGLTVLEPDAHGNMFSAVDENAINQFLYDTGLEFDELKVWEQLDDSGRKLFSAFYDLNKKGQELAIDYVQLLAENEKYLK